MPLPGAKLDELRRMHRVADMLVSCHSMLRDQYAKYSLLLNLSALLVSLWLVGMVFVDPVIGSYLTPGQFDPKVFLGLLALATFGLSLTDLKVDWKGKASSHEQAAVAYAMLKADAAAVLSDAEAISEEQFRDLARDYSKIGEFVVPIPESKFNKLKKKHLMKVEVSRILSNKPGRNIWCILLSLWWRDNFSRR